ncbi:hypothetical protein LDENG_00153960 [Lucifuga dentata]|nr:hypothetical protein LDENG_00153960 [Lucifuga dentata]
MGVMMAVAYKDISRTGDESGFRYNDKSWALYCSIFINTYEFIHNSHHSSRLGVYLNHRAGILSFYSVSGNVTLLHRVQTTFTQLLYAGLHFFGDTAEFL